MTIVANQLKKALNKAILEVAGVPRKPMTPAEKLKLARQHKRKAAASTARSATSTAEANVPPPSPTHMAEERHMSPPHSTPIIIIDEPINVQPINEIKVNLEAEAARREKRKPQWRMKGI